MPRNNERDYGWRHFCTKTFDIEVVIGIGFGTAKQTINPARLFVLNGI